MKKRLLSLALVLAVCLAMLPTAAFAAGSDFNVGYNEGSLNPTTGSGFNAQVYEITDDNADVDVTGTTSNSRIVVTGDNVTLHLNNASMILKGRNGSPIEIAENKSVTIIFAGENKLTADAGGPGILVNQGAMLTIKEADNTSGANSLTVTGAQQDEHQDGGDASVTEGGGFAGIGGPNSSSELKYTGTIKIESGIVNAYGFGYGAGIGGGDYSSGGTIQISGGKVTAINGGTKPDGWGSNMHQQASGIGGSQGMDSGLITISGDAEVKAYGGYACAGIGGGKNDITITDNAKVTAYGGEDAAGIGGYNRDKGESTITISGSANVTAYGGKYASGLGQGSKATSVKLTIGENAVVSAYSDGRKAAITGTPQEGSASIINMYAQNINLGKQDVALTLTADDNSANDITLVGGYKGIGTTCAAGNYTVTAPAEQEGSSYRLIPTDGASFKVAAAADNSAYKGTKMMLMLVSDNGATIQLNPTSGTTIRSGNDEPLVLDEENGVIVVPAGGSVDDVVWSAGGTVTKSGKQTIHVASIALDTNALTLYTNRDPKTATLTATVSPDNATDKTVTWTSGDEKVATVENGVVTAVGNGTTTITAKAGDKTAVCTVTTYSSSSGSSSSGSSKPSYSVTAPGTTENGSVTVSPKNATKGSTVTVTVKPDDGYELGKLTVTDAKGGTIDVTDKGNGKYTFTMPASKVTVTPTFVKIAEQPSQPEKTFADVASSDWYADAVRYVTEKGLMNGTGADTFSPSASTTRGMLMTVLARYAGEDTTGGAIWYEKGMNWAKAHGVSDGTNPTVNITREQLVTMLYRYAGSPASDGKLDGFSDAASVSSYAVNAMQWAVANGIVNGSNGKLNPQNNATRAEVAAILMRFCEMNK